MEDETVLWAACIEAAAALIAGGVAGDRGGEGWPQEQVSDIAQRIYRAIEERRK